MKSPFTRYSPLQVKQFITHGNVFVNNRKVTFGNYSVKVGDTISIKGPIFFFYPSLLPLSNASSSNNTVLLQSHLNRFLENHQNTLLLRRLKDKNYLNSLTDTLSSSPCTLESFSNLSSHDNLTHLVSFIQKLRLKRFTETFFLTYRNLHLLNHTIAPSSLSYQQFLDSKTHIEKHIKPIFEYLGHNQSVFLL